MKYVTRVGHAAEQKTECLVTSMAGGAQIARSQRLRDVYDSLTRDFDDKAGNTLTLSLGKGAAQQRLLIAGGADQSVSPATFVKIAGAAARALAQLEIRNAVWALTGTRVEDRDPYWRAWAGMQALSQAVYRFEQYKTRGKLGAPQVGRIAMLADQRTRAGVQRAVRHGNALKTGLDLARDLGNTPPNVCNPTYLLREARKLSRLDKVSVTALDEKKMTELGMGAFMAVSRGSETPGRMIIVQYKGGRAGDPPVALVGKGITFDTGGISLKPGPNMHEMKFDMCGAATVLGTTRAVAEAGLPINLVTVLAAAENMPSGDATRPGDIVTTLSGQTVEILNTDAEGRLVLCDALTYVQRYKPRVVIDVATLTGAAIVALGNHATALFSKHDELANALLEAGEWTHDRAWRLPLWDEYQSQLKSNFADIPNIGSPGGGSIVAACFLARFTEELSWAHLDIAGSGFQGGAGKGATGRPVALLYRYLAEQAGA